MAAASTARIGLILLGLAPAARAVGAQQAQPAANVIKEMANLKLSGLVQIYRTCIRDIVFLEPVIVPIPVGCEVIDCCPGCPGGPLTWRINLGGDRSRAVILEFDRLAPEVRKGLRLEGKGKWLDERRLRIEPGETVLHGFPYDRRGKPSLATPHFELDTAAGKARDGDTAGDVALSVRQFVGDFQVNEYFLVYRFWWCFPPPIRLTDRITLQDNTSADKAVVLLDARRSSGCVNDEPVRDITTVGVGSVLSNGGCRSEVAVFSDDDAVQLFENVTAWTDPLGDNFLANLAQGLWQAPVSVWITVASGTAAAPADAALANQLFNTNHAGVAFVPTTTNLVGNAAATAAIGVPTCTAANITALRGSGFFTANRLNVYYVNTATTGFTCVADRNIVVVGTLAKPESLSHEIGHSYSLDHTNTADYDGDGVLDLPSTNVMFAGGTGRTTFSEPQGFRMNLNPTSMLNVNGVRTNPLQRACADATISAQCPWLGLDVVPN